MQGCYIFFDYIIDMVLVRLGLARAEHMTQQYTRHEKFRGERPPKNDDWCFEFFFDSKHGTKKHGTKKRITHTHDEEKVLAIAGLIKESNAPRGARGVGTSRELNGLTFWCVWVILMTILCFSSRNLVNAIRRKIIRKK